MKTKRFGRRVRMEGGRLNHIGGRDAGSGLARALEKSVARGFEGFGVVVQPIVSARSGEIQRGEVLLRWYDGEGTVSPGVFVPVLEATGLIVPVGRWVMEQTARLSREYGRYDPEFRLSFNVSYRQIIDDEFGTFLEHTVRSFGLNPSRLTLELTESCADQRPERLAALMQQCGNMGVSIALDDFGSGYSSLSLLMKYPVDIVKLDKSIVASLCVSSSHMQFIRRMVQACHEFGKQVICEGVETEEQRNLVCQTGSDLIQGYYYYRPMETSGLRDLLMARARRQKTEDEKT